MSAPSVDPRWRSPLAHRRPLWSGGSQVDSDISGHGYTTISIAERPFRGLLILRGEPAALAGPVQNAVGLHLPTAAGGATTAVAEDPDASVSALWLGPDEWLLVTGPGREASLATTLASTLGTALSGELHQLVDVSDYYTTIGVTGDAAPALLAKLFIVDLHPRACPAGTALATTAARAPVWLWVREDTDSWTVIDHDHPTGGPKSAPNPNQPRAFEIIVRRSVADYLWCLLAEAGREWGLEPRTPVGQVRLHLPHLMEA